MHREPLHEATGAASPAASGGTSPAASGGTSPAASGGTGPAAPGDRTIAIVGGGLAGIAAALRVVDAGHRAVIVETRRKLGGRATSFVDPRTGELLDNCQHVLMGCCTNLVDLYARLGVMDRIEWSTATHWANPPAAPDVLAPTRPAALFPAPGHFALAFLRMRLLSWGEKVAISRAMWRMIRLGLRGRVAWRSRSFAEFLAECRQPASAIEKFWAPVVVSACNLPVDRVAANHALQVFQEGFLGDRWSSAMGLSTVPLVALYDPAEALLREHGGEIQLGVSAKAIAFDGQRVTGVVTEEGFVHAAAVIAAVPPDRLDKLVSAPLRAADRRLQRLGEIGFSPILGVHLRFEAAVMETPHLVLPGRGTQWLFNKGLDETGRQHVHAVISAAEGWMELDEAAIVERVVADIHATLPRSIGLVPVEFRAVKEKRATFACVPGIDDLRPSAAPSFAGGPAVRNLFLAGDWCDTGWPATMEGAVRSGYAAAAACCARAEDAGGQRGGVVDDVPMGRFARALGLR